jgi:hypothetical protein
LSAARLYKAAHFGELLRLPFRLHVIQPLQPACNRITPFAACARMCARGSAPFTSVMSAFKSAGNALNRMMNSVCGDVSLS